MIDIRLANLPGKYEAPTGRLLIAWRATWAAAQGLYESLGLKPIEPYVFNPIPGTKFLALDL